MFFQEKVAVIRIRNTPSNRPAESKSRKFECFKRLSVNCVNFLKYFEGQNIRKFQQQMQFISGLLLLEVLLICVWRMSQNAPKKYEESKIFSCWQF